MIKKDSLGLIAILLFAIIFLLIQISFISSEGIKTFTESTKIGNLFGLNEEDIIVSAEIQYLEIKDLETKEKKVRLTFIEENAKVNINGNLFTNIVPQKIAGHPTYIELNKYGEIVKADFTVNEKGGNYTFGDNTIEVPPNSRVFFDENTGIDIKIPDGLDLTEFPNLLKYIPDGYLTTIKGKEIILPNGINLVDGELSIEEKGYFLENGEAIYKQNLLKVDKDDKKILIVNSDADMSDYEGNWIRQTADILELQSSKEGYIDVDFIGDHEILNTDDKDKLSANIWKGDGLKFEDRDEKGLIPKAIHKSSERGGTTIENDKIEFAFNKKGFFILPRPLEIEDITSNKYQSAAFEIESDSPEIDDKLRINSYRQFVILSEDDKELITYNKYGLPISAKVKDNELQTIEQIREKYPDLKFEVPPVFIITYFIPSPAANPLNEENLPPYLLYLTDEFLKENPEVMERIDNIKYTNEFDAHVIGSTITLGRSIVDPVEGALTKIREITKPHQVIIHEYEHGQDNYIKKEELEYIRSLNDPLFNPLFERIDLLRQEEKDLVNILSELEKNEEFIKEIKDISEGKRERNELAKIWWEIKKEALLKSADTRPLIEEIYKKYYYSYPHETLEQKYNQLGINAMKKLSETSIGENLESLQLEGFLSSIEKDIIKETDEIFNRLDNINPIDYALESNLDSLQFEENKKKKRRLLKELKSNREDVLKDESKVIEIYQLVLWNRMRQFYSGETDIVYVRDSQKIEDLLGLLMSVPELKKGEGSLQEIVFLYDELKYPELEKHRGKIDQIVRIEAGLPYRYSLKNLNPKETESVLDSSYSELSSTYREESIGTRRMEVQSANPSVSEMYKQLTQVAFDSGKMKVEEYRAIMGEEHCKETDCSDKLCVEYKLLCCEKHPSSPYCPKNPIY